MKRKHPFFWIDAFTQTALSGNPCAVLLNADDLSDSQMLSIAKEMNLSETAFVQKSSRADFKARYFTPEQVIPLAGHPTIATMHVLVEQGQVSVKEEGPAFVTLELTAGIVPIEISRCQKDKTVTITMSQLKPEFLNVYSASDLLPLFGLTQEDLLPGVPIQTVSTGSRFLLVPLKHHLALKKLNMNIESFRGFRDRGDFFSPHFFCLPGATENGQTFARHLGLPPDTAEDSFTGSATGCMGAYLWHYRLIQKPHFIAEQGHWMGRPGSAQVEVVGPNDDIETVRVSGSAVTIIRGEIEVEF